MIASRFKQGYDTNDDIVIFASGVSNSEETDRLAFQREESLLRETIASTHGKLVYFSTTSLFDPSRSHAPYTNHKRRMEALVAGACSDYLICRACNITGQKGNPNNLINYLIAKILKGQSFDLWQHARRNILDIDDLCFAVDSILRCHPALRVVNLFNPQCYEMRDIVQAIELHTGKQAQYTLIPRGSAYAIPDAFGLPAFYERIGLHFDDDYLVRILRKYHPMILPRPLIIETKAS